jgi:hypothetical protein
MVDVFIGFMDAAYNQTVHEWAEEENYLKLWHKHVYII